MDRNKPWERVERNKKTVPDRKKSKCKGLEGKSEHRTEGTETLEYSQGQHSTTAGTSSLESS